MGFVAAAGAIADAAVTDVAVTAVTDAVVTDAAVTAGADVAASAAADAAVSAGTDAALSSATSTALGTGADLVTTDTLNATAEAAMASGSDVAGNAGAQTFMDQAGNLVKGYQTAKGFVNAAGNLLGANNQYRAAGRATKTLSNAALTTAQQQQQAAQKQAQLLSTAATTASTQEQAGVQAAIANSDITLQNQTALQQPYIDAGNKALHTLSTGLQPGGQYNRAFTMADAQNMPAYDFALKQGEQAIQNAAAAGGQVQGTNMQQQATTFAEGTASQFEQQAFTQWMAQNNLSLDALQNMVKTGQVSATDLQQALAQHGVSIETLNQAMGNAQAAGTMGAANANANGVVNAANAKSAGTMGAANAQAAGTVAQGNAVSSGLTALGNGATSASTLASIANPGSTTAGITNARWAGDTYSAGNTAPITNSPYSYSNVMPDASLSQAPTANAGDLSNFAAQSPPVDTSQLPMPDLNMGTDPTASGALF